MSNPPLLSSLEGWCELSLGFLQPEISPPPRGIFTFLVIVEQLAMLLFNHLLPWLLERLQVLVQL